MWEIMTPGFPSDPAAHSNYIQDVDLAMAMADPFLQLAQDAADNDFAGFDFSEWSILTDKNADGVLGGKQEFLVRTSVVPEPGTVVLLLSGMLLLVGVARKRRLEVELGDR